MALHLRMPLTIRHRVVREPDLLRATSTDHPSYLDGPDLHWMCLHVSRTLRIDGVCRLEELCEVLPSVDCAPGLLSDGPSSRRLWNSCDARLFHEAGCRLVHKYCVYKDPFPHPALWRGNSLTVIVRGSGYGHRAADESAHSDSSIGSTPGGGVLSIRALRGPKSLARDRTAPQ